MGDNAEAAAPPDVARRRADTRHLLRASAIVTGMDLATRALGVLRDSCAAAVFGVNRATDAFQVAKSLPDMFSTWIEAPVRAAFVPLFTRSLHEQGEDRAWEITSNVLNCIGLVLIVLVIVLELFAGQVVRLFSTGFKDPAVWEDSARLAEILVVSVFFSVLAAILSSLQNVYRNQVFPALGRIASSLAVVGLIVGFGRTLGVSAWALGILVGSILTFVLQLSLVFKHRRQYRLICRPRAPEIRSLVTVAFPLFIGLTGTRIDILLDRNFASFLPQGRLSVLILATAVSAVIADLVLNVSQSVMFPHFAELMARGQLAELRRRLAQAIDGYLFFIMGATALLTGGARPIVGLLFEHGRFTREDAALTAMVLPILAAGAVPHMVGQVLSQVYVSGGETMTLMKIGFWRIGFKAVVSGLLLLPLGFVGLAIASSASSFFRFALLWRRLDPEQRPRTAVVLRPAIVSVLAGAVSALGVYGLFWAWPPVAGGLGGEALRVASVCAIGLALFVGAAALMGHGAPRAVTGLVTSRLGAPKRRGRRG